MQKHHFNRGEAATDHDQGCPTGDLPGPLFAVQVGQGPDLDGGHGQSPEATDEPGTDDAPAGDAPQGSALLVTEVTAQGQGVGRLTCGRGSGASGFQPFHHRRLPSHICRL